MRRENLETLESETDTNEVASNMSVDTSGGSSSDEPMAPATGSPDSAVEQVKRDLAGIRIIEDTNAMDERGEAGGGESSAGELPATTGPPGTFSPAAQPPFVHTLPLEVNFDYARELRQGWLMEARRIEAAGELSAVDLHLINLYLVGDKEVYSATTFPLIWDVVSDERKLDMFKDHTVHQYCCNAYDRREERRQEAGGDASEIGAEYDNLLFPTKIRHTVITVVTTDGRILCRGASGGNFVKQQSGGGKRGKSMYSCHFAAQDQLPDEFGLSRGNPAIIDKSNPIITVERPHWSDKGFYEGATIMYNQYVLLDAAQVHKVQDAEGDAESLACWNSDKRKTGKSLTQDPTRQEIGASGRSEERDSAVEKLRDFTALKGLASALRA